LRQSNVKWKAFVKILLHVHTSLANVLVNKFPRREILVNSPFLGYATIKEAMISVSAVTSRSGG
jgi:hypothetical protein